MFGRIGYHHVFTSDATVLYTKNESVSASRTLTSTYHILFTYVWVDSILAGLFVFVFFGPTHLSDKHHHMERLLESMLSCHEMMFGIGQLPDLNPQISRWDIGWFAIDG